MVLDCINSSSLSSLLLKNNNSREIDGALQTSKYLKIGTGPASQKNIGMFGIFFNFHWKTSKFSLALQPEALVNTSGRVDFSSPAPAFGHTT